MNEDDYGEDDYDEDDAFYETYEEVERNKYKPSEEIQKASFGGFIAGFLICLFLWMLFG